MSDIDAILESTGFPPEDLTLEITESVGLDDSDAITETIRALRGRGLRLAIDDFGTGQAGLTVLRRSPIQSLKIDRSLVVGLDAAGERAIIHAIVGFAQALGIQTVAEGIETPAQFAELRALGCTLGQGHYFSRPCPAEEIAALLVTSTDWSPDDQVDPAVPQAGISTVGI